MFRLTLLIVFGIFLAGLFYYVSWSERVEDIKEKKRVNRKSFFTYRQKLEAENFRRVMKERYNIEVEEELK